MSDYITDKFAHIRRAVTDRINNPDFADWYSEYAKNDILDLLDACAYYRAYPEIGIEALEQVTKERDDLKALAETQAEVIALVNKAFSKGIIES